MEKPDEIGFENVNDGVDKILENIKEKIKKDYSNAEATSTEINSIIKSLITLKKIPLTQENFNKVLASVAHLLQIGATSPKFAANRQITDYGVDIRAGDLKDACNKAGTTPRKLARGIKNIIVKVAAAHGIEGNLAKSYKLENPSCDKQDLIWVSDFQTFSEDPAMPNHVRTWLLQNYRNRFKPKD